ncbi:hypothetical protein PYR67_22780 [Rhizobium sp. BC49]|uniref:hypothetical protein n=1 Tax=Rhizobium sp. BC49 TaxID=3031127 RepID=UPI0023D8A752|nr:hypothetical protein [Rhizobium sp. BC49]MDF0662144.1 hypothetical protein [Rhizobium sp. BC49]
MVTGTGSERKAIGIHAGAFAPYRAISIATGALDEGHRPDLTPTKPSATIGPFPQWAQPGKIVALDPWGHRIADDHADSISEGWQIQPSIAVTEGRLEMPEISSALQAGHLQADGRILDSRGGMNVTRPLPKVVSRSGTRLSFQRTV